MDCDFCGQPIDGEPTLKPISMYGGIDTEILEVCEECA